MIDEHLVRDLLDEREDDASLVLLAGDAQVVDRTALDSDAFRGAAVLVTRRDLVERLGTTTPTPDELTRLVAALRDTIGKLGA
ncbi:hypothetical protein [Streptomyces sp. NPDC060194]|uniref:hypothetical protein n=1 Tax=Streptomyces sp. NPDC060194 TaxID=3347069 RepID=UPI003647ED04